MKRIFTFLLLLGTITASFGQQDAMMTQYMFNGLYLNPAYSGSHKFWESTLQYRNQWVNFEGAPRTSFLSVDGPVFLNTMGVGLTVSDDRLGVTHQTDVSGIYSYHIKTDEKSKLSFGVKAGFANYSSNVSDLKIWDKTEDLYISQGRNRMFPKFGFGAYYYREKFYAGISIPTLLAYDSERNFSLDLEKSSLYRRHYIFTAGGVIKINDIVTLRPSTLIKYVANAPVQADLNFSVLLMQTIWLGASYRTDDAVVGIIEYQLNRSFRLGYSYDFTTSMLNRYSAGTHEIMLGFDFMKKDAIKTKNPRFF